MGERLTFTFALTGRREWGYGTQGVALGSGLIGLSARAGPQPKRFQTISTYLNKSAGRHQCRPALLRCKRKAVSETHVGIW